MSSIRTSLLLGTVVCLIVVIAVAGITLHRAVRSTLMRQFDRAMEDKARLLASMVDREFGVIEVEFDDLDMREFEPGEEAGYLEVWLADGEVLYRSPSLAEQDLGRVGGKLDEAVFDWARVDDERRVRVVGLTVLPGLDEEDDEFAGEESAEAEEGSQTVSLALARGTEAVDTFLAGLRNILAAVGFFAGLIGAGILGVVIRRSLRPLDHLAGEIAKLDSDLSSRVGLPLAPREIAPVVNQLNELLGRLEAAFRRERVFSADIAHELRTPLAGLRSSIEVAISRPREASDYCDTLEESLDIICRIQEMVHRLLYLSRLDAGQIDTEEKRIDLSELVRASWAPLAASAKDRRLDVQTRLPQDVFVQTDPMYLEVAIRNVLENAVVHANEAGRVRVEVNGNSESADLLIVNSGSAVPQKQVSELVERFARGDQARNASGSHCGLGLALVHKIAAILNVSVDIRSRVGGDFAVRLSLDKNGAKAGS